MNRLFLIVKANGEIWLSNDPSNAKSLTGVAVGGSLEVYSNSLHVKVATITGNSGAYGITRNTSATDGHGNSYSKVF